MNSIGSMLVKQNTLYIILNSSNINLNTKQYRKFLGKISLFQNSSYRVKSNPWSFKGNVLALELLYSIINIVALVNTVQ